MRRVLVAILCVAMLAAMAVPAAATGKKNDGHRPRHDVVDIVIKVSGSEGFDRNPHDYDILREALVATDLVDALKDADDITVWAPKDRAFKRLARDLGWKGRGEKRAFKFLAHNVPADVLTTVLLYHVTPKELKYRRVKRLARRGAEIDTLAEQTIELEKVGRHRVRLIDKAPDLRDPITVPPVNVKASNGIIHTINRILIPDMGGPDVVDVVIEVSGSEGFDRNPHDYDLLREALVAADLVQALKDADDITVWAPKDRAFKRLARDLGWKGRSEKKAFKFLANNVPADVLKNVLLYHVTPKELKYRRVLRLARRGAEIDTLLGETIELEKIGRRHVRLIDKEPDLRDPITVPPVNVKASNGIIHTINRVLIPIDL